MHTTTSNAAFVQNKASGGGHTHSQHNAHANSTESVDNVDNLVHSAAHQQEKGILPDAPGTARVTSSSNDANGNGTSHAISTPNVSLEPPATANGDSQAAVQSAPDHKKEKKGKKAKDASSGTVLVYSDNVIAPEEKMAQLSKYRPNWKQGNAPTEILGDVGDAVTGTTGETVRDPQD